MSNVPAGNSIFQLHAWAKAEVESRLIALQNLGGSPLFCFWLLRFSGSWVKSCIFSRGFKDGFHRKQHNLLGGPFQRNENLDNCLAGAIGR